MAIRQPHHRRAWMGAQKNASDVQKTPNPSIAWRLALKQAEQIATPSQNTQLSEVDEMTLQTIKMSVLKFVKDEDGLTIVEYAVAGSLITAAVILAFTNLGAAVSTQLIRITAAITG